MLSLITLTLQILEPDYYLVIQISRQCEFVTILSTFISNKRQSFTTLTYD